MVHIAGTNILILSSGYHRLMNCERGYHYCQPKDLVGWLSDQIETFGETLREDDKCVAQQIRFVRKLVWTPRMAREFALSCCCALGGEYDVAKYRSGIPINHQWEDRDIAFDMNPYNAARSIGFRYPNFSSKLLRILEEDLIPKYAELYLLDNWIAALKMGCFTSDDGSGNWADDNYLLEGDVFSTPPKEATQVAWFNK